MPPTAALPDPDSVHVGLALLLMLLSLALAWLPRGRLLPVVRIKVNRRLSIKRRTELHDSVN